MRVAAAAFGLVGFGAFAQAQTVHHIQSYWILELSDDGQAGAGYSNLGEDRRAVMWTAAGGINPYGHDQSIPGTFNDAVRISGDGSTAFGHYWDAVPITPYRYRTTSGSEAIPTIPGLPFVTWGHASFTGDAACGNAYLNPGPGAVTRAFRWTASGGMQLVGISGRGDATDISTDGELVCGWTFQNGSVSKPWMWSSVTGTHQLPELADTGNFGSAAMAMSSTGQYVVGYSGATAEGALWIDGQIQGLGKLEEARTSVGTSVSDDGSIIVGFSQTNNGLQGTVWTRDHGWELVGDYLSRFGVTLSDVTFFDRSWRVTADGQTFYGHFGDDSYVVTVPGPSVLAFAALTGLGAGRRRRSVKKQRN